MDKENNIKEKFKQALISTVKVISDDYKINIVKKNASSQNFNFFELDNLNSKQDFIRFRAEADSEALRKKFSKKVTRNLKTSMKDVNFIVLSPGISLKKTKHKKRDVGFSSNHCKSLVIYSKDSK